MKYCIIVIILLLITILSADLMQMTITEQGKGSYVIQETRMDVLDEETVQTAQRVGINWDTSDPSAIANGVNVSSATGNTFVEWILNNERAALYNDSSVPVWEHQIGDIDFDLPMDMLEDGSVIVLGDEPTLKFFTPENSIPIWETTLSSTIIDLCLEPQGLGAYVTYFDSGNTRSNVEYYSLGVAEPIWTVSYPGVLQSLDISGDGSTLVLTQYGEFDNMFVLSSEDGSQIFQGPEYNQNPPAISYDASVIVNGDYGGVVTVYEYNSELETYEESWTYSTGGDNWIGGMAISADGSTIAVGTLKFLSAGYDGEVYVFNRATPTPLWVYENVGDYVIAMDVSDDGALIAAASYGPLDHSSPDFFLFRKQSSIPILEINTAGSFFDVDISGDGSLCAVSGKAVHAREMGSGGLLYNIDSYLGGGYITGIVDLEGTDDNSGVKVSVVELTDYYGYSDAAGNFLIEHVPSDIYSVQFEKVGYLANNVTEIIVFDDEETDIGTIQMIQAGEPAYELNASQAMGLEIELNWEVHNWVQEPESHNIYRKRYAADPYPEEPLASCEFTGDDMIFTDNTALPLIEYYYVVTNVYTGGLESPYSNEVQGWTSSGFVTNEISAYVGEDPVIDGVIEAAEWADAFQLDVSDFWGTYDNMVNPVSSVVAYFKVNLEMDKLYCAVINHNDENLEDHDEVALYMDDNNDGVFSPQTEGNEGNYWAAYYASGNQLKFRPIYDTGGVGDVFFLPEPELEVIQDVDGITYEFTVPIGEEPWMINPSAENMSSLAIFVLDDNAPDPHGFDGWWPYDNTDLFEPTDFGTMHYGASVAEPEPPHGLVLEIGVGELLTISWQQPDMNDFDHYNVYLALNEEPFELLGETVGIGYYYQVEDFNTEHTFYVTTVNQIGYESDPSETVEYFSVNADDDIPQLVTNLRGNYPNPFNPATKIEFSVNTGLRSNDGNYAGQAESTQYTEILVYNIKGQLVQKLLSEELEAGVHSVIWDGKDDHFRSVASGIYFYRMTAGEYDVVKKMILMK